MLFDYTTPPVDILIENGVISKIADRIDVDSVDVVDACGDYALAGFVDLHVHGGGGYDFMDGTVESFENIVKTHLKYGTTLIVPTAMSATKRELLRFIDAYKEFKEKSCYAELAAGLHLEGPYFSNANGKSKGAQNGSVIRAIDFNEVEVLLDRADGSIIRWDAAPEVPNAYGFASLMKDRGIVCAIAHTDATAEEAEKGFEAGFSHVTHFYNATTAYKKRDQLVTAGVVEQAYLDKDVTVELICDGKHIPKACMLLALKIKGAENVSGITDAMRIAGTDMKSGKLGSVENGSEVIVDDNVAKLPDLSSYAGSICTMQRALKTICMDYGIDIVTASKMLSYAPSKLMGLLDRYGSLEQGKAGDVVLVGRDFEVKKVIKSGNVIE